MVHVYDTIIVTCAFIRLMLNTYFGMERGRGANLRLFCYPGNSFLIRSVNQLTVHNSEIFEKGLTTVFPQTMQLTPHF